MGTSTRAGKVVGKPESRRSLEGPGPEGPEDLGDTYLNFCIFSHILGT